jgi:hypothetical protein
MNYSHKKKHTQNDDLSTKIILIWHLQIKATNSYINNKLSTQALTW